MKELTEHIRTVHFTVLAVALILTAALQIEKKRPLERAAADAEAILRLQQRWEDTAKELRKAVDASSSESFTLSFPLASFPITKPVAGLYVVKSLKVYDNKKKDIDGGLRVAPLTFRLEREWLYARAGSEQTVANFPNSWKTLRDFLTFWDEIHDGTVAFVPFAVVPAKSGYCSQVELSNSFAGIENDLSVHAERESSQKWIVSPLLRSPFGSKMCEFQSVTVTTLKLDIARAFASVVPQAANWGTGKSTEEFVELIAASKYLEESPLAPLAAALRERANSDTERIELFQAKLPAEAIPTYGTIILICCQFYLLAHFAELRRITTLSRSYEPPTGYIGLYDNPLTRGFSILSLTVIPFIPLVISAMTIQSKTLRYFLWSAVLISATIGLISSFTLIAIRKNISSVG